jgi:hypothetical protein
MSIDISSTYGHSPEIDLNLIVNDQRLPLNQVGVDFLMLRSPCEIPPRTKGQVVVTIDGRSNVRDIMVIDGANADSGRIAIQ